MLLAAGSGSRAGHDTNKVLLPLAGLRVLTWSLRWSAPVAAITRRVLVVAESEESTARRVLAREMPALDVEVIVGGPTRHASELQALRALAPHVERGELDVIVIHDAARPLAGTSLFADVIRTARRAGGAIPVRPQPGLIPIDADSPTDAGQRLVAVQTPQAFRAKPLLAAYEQADRDAFVGTDTASCIEQYTDIEVRCVEGPARNIKITFPEDLFLAEHLLAQAHWDLTSREAMSP